MNRTILAVAAALALFAGCGKKDATEPTAGAEGASPENPKSAKVTTQVKAQLDSVDQKIENKQYDDAVAALLQAKAAAKTEADRIAYEDQFFAAQRALVEKAQSDPKAKESYEALGRIVTGR